MGIEAPIMGQPGLYSQNVIDIAGDASEGLLCSGVFVAAGADEKGQELFYLINLDCEDKMITVREEGQLLWEKFELGQKASMVLPRNVVVSGGEIVKSTAEITQVTENGMPLIYRNKNQKIERRKTAVWILRL